MNVIKVLGHVPPDTDSVCSPIAYAWYLNQTGLEAKAYIGGKLNKETEYILQRFNISLPEKIESVEESDQLVILDTNNPEEMIAGFDKAKIIEIVDHHKLAGLTTPNPLKVTMRTYACVSTVLFELFRSEIIEKMPKEIAGLMLSAIISDTLNFTSPTTTDKDKEVANVLSKLSGEDLNELASKMFEAKSNLDGMTERDILTSDHKNFKFGDKTYKVAVLETTDPNQALSKKAELLTEMKQLEAEDNLAGVFFFVVDILKSESTLLVSNPVCEDIAVKAFGKQWNNGLMMLPGVVSRKKQMVPPLEKAGI